MPKKSNGTAAPELDSISTAERATILRSISDKVESDPPVGERYEYLLKEIVLSAINESGLRLAKVFKECLADELYGYVASYGPAEQYLFDPQISEVMINGPDQIFVEKNGQMILTDTRFDNNQQVRFCINHMILPRGRFVDSRHAVVDSRLPDGSRLNAVIPPVAPEWPAITVRRFMKDKLTIQQLIDLGSITPKIANFVEVCVKARLNIIVAGNTSSGKTTFLNILAGHIGDWERIVTIEDSAELNLHQLHKVSLEAQPPDHRGEGAVTIRDLVKNCLRMRPDRIVVGEVRGAEALDMLQAMNTGHDGSLTTIHSNGPRDTISRLETMILMGGVEVPIKAIRQQIASAVNLVVYLSRMADGSRRCTHISEVVGMEGDVVTMTDIFKFEQTGIDADRKIQGVFKSTGLRPTFSQALQVAGYSMDASWFGN
jgi:pilus assembly protein CpaF